MLPSKTALYRALTLAAANSLRVTLPVIGRFLCATALLLLAVGAARAAITQSGAVAPDPIDPASIEDISVGVQGIGSLRVDGGSSLESDNVQIGASGVGYATVTGAGSQWSAYSIEMGASNGVGRLDITDGAVVTSQQDFQIGGYNGAGATVVVDGVGSTLWADSRLDVGVDGPGTLQISNQAIVVCANYYDLRVGTGGRVELRDGSLSGLTFDSAGVVTGAGEITAQNHFENGGLIEVGPGDKFTVRTSQSNIQNYGKIRIVGGEAEFLARLTNSDEGEPFNGPAEISLSNGVLRVSDPTSSYNPDFYHTDALLVSLAGTNEVYGTMQQRVGQTLVTGDSTLVFHDPVDFQSGSLEVHAWSTALFLAGAELNSSVNLSIAHGAPVPIQLAATGDPSTSFSLDLRVSFAESIAPQVGDVFPLISGSFGYTNFYNVELPELPVGMVWSLDESMSSIQLRILAAPQGDYNSDGYVDAADYTVWRNAVGSSALLAADGDGSGIVDAGDYAVWKNNFGTDAWTLDAESAAQAALAAVPEPGTTLLLLLGALLLARCRP